MNDQLESPQSVEVLDPPVEAKPRVTARPKAHSSKPAPAPAPQRPPPRPKRSAQDDNEADSEDDNFIGRHGGKLTVVALLVVGALTTWLISQPKSTVVRKAPERIVTIQAVPPPPPPPPPPPKIQPPPPQEQKMIEQAPVEEKAPDPEPKPADEPPALGTNIKGDGPGVSGLGRSGNGNRIGGSGNGGNGRAGGPFDGFARKTQNRVQGAIAAHHKTRAARISGCELRVWVDTTGRITRVKVSPSTGDAATDLALQGDVLVGVQLEPPPPGMPMPIVMRVSARRPN